MMAEVHTSADKDNIEVSPFEHNSNHDHDDNHDNAVAASSSTPAAIVALVYGNAPLLWQCRGNVWIPLVLVSITCLLVGTVVGVPLLEVEDNDDGRTMSSLSSY